MTNQRHNRLQLSGRPLLPTTTARDPYQLQQCPSSPWIDALAKLSLTIAAKQKEDRITSQRSVKYREECLTCVMREFPGDIRVRQMTSFTVDELENFTVQVLANYSKSRYNGMMQNLRASSMKLSEPK